MAKRKKSKTKKLEKFDKYAIYTQAVQSPETDVQFFKSIYRRTRKKPARLFREDFCAAYATSCAWVQDNKNHIAFGVDLDPEPLDYGNENNLPTLSREEQSRLFILEADVLKVGTPKMDIIAAMNFSYCFFKERNQLKAYFAKAFKDLKKDGLFFIDCFGGTLTQEPNEESTKHRNFIYFWEQEGYDPVTGGAKFNIHFRRKGEGFVREKVFTYDWRLWSIPELRDIMMDVGFKRVDIYWEGTKKNGSGNGKFRKVTKGEVCDAWIAYVIGVK